MQTFATVAQLMHPLTLQEIHGTVLLEALKLYPEIQAEHTFAAEQAEQRGLVQLMQAPLRAEKPIWQTEQLFAALQTAQLGTAVRLQAKQLPFEFVNPWLQITQPVPRLLQVWQLGKEHLLVHTVPFAVY